jgi:phage gpG-like protein
VSTPLPLSRFGETFLAATPAPLPPALGTAIGAVLLSGLRRRFSQGVDGLGRPWKRLAHGRPGGGDKPLLDTGVLRNSYTITREPDGVSIGSKLPQARLHEYGGTVRAKRTKYLAIPLTVEAKRFRPRLFPTPLRFVPTERGGLLVERRKGGRAQYALVREVKVPARPHVAPSAEDLRAIDEIAAEYGFKLVGSPAWVGGVPG